MPDSGLAKQFIQISIYVPVQVLLVFLVGLVFHRYCFPSLGSSSLWVIVTDIFPQYATFKKNFMMSLDGWKHVIILLIFVFPFDFYAFFFSLFTLF